MFWVDAAPHAEEVPRADAGRGLLRRSCLDRRRLQIRIHHSAEGTWVKIFLSITFDLFLKLQFWARFVMKLAWIFRYILL